MKFLTLALVLSLFLSCKDSNRDKDHKQASKNIEKQMEKFVLTSYCFYQLDDKYSTENDGQIIDNWLNQKSIDIINHTEIESIFSHNAGGPNGAEWNPSTNLYIAILFPATPQNSTDPVELLINGKVYEDVYLKYNANLIWYKVKREFWENEVRTINTSDIEDMYPHDFLENIRAGNVQPITDLNYGDIIKFETIHKGDTLSSFFHTTYGE